MHRGRASSPKNYSAYPSGQPGLLFRPVPPHAPPGGDPRWISAPACAECGDSRETRDYRAAVHADFELITRSRTKIGCFSGRTELMIAYAEKVGGLWYRR